MENKSLFHNKGCKIPWSRRGKKTNVKFNGAKRYSFDHLVTHSTFAIPVAG